MIENMRQFVWKTQDTYLSLICKTREINICH